MATPLHLEKVEQVKRRAMHYLRRTKKISLQECNDKPSIN